jgi:hypothetical protein
MSRPDPIEYAERLYAAIRDANFSPISFLAFGNAVKDGVPMRSMPRIAVEPFMRVVGDMLDLEQAAAEPVVDGEVIEDAALPSAAPPAESTAQSSAGALPETDATPANDTLPAVAPEAPSTSRARRLGGKR